MRRNAYHMHEPRLIVQCVPPLKQSEQLSVRTLPIQLGMGVVQ